VVSFPPLIVTTALFFQTPDRLFSFPDLIVQDSPFAESNILFLSPAQAVFAAVTFFNKDREDFFPNFHWFCSLGGGISTFHFYGHEILRIGPAAPFFFFFVISRRRIPSLLRIFKARGSGSIFSFHLFPTILHGPLMTGKRHMSPFPSSPGTLWPGTLTFPKPFYPPACK